MCVVATVSQAHPSPTKGARRIDFVYASDSVSSPALVEVA
jgi:hypothetical protein